MVEVAPAMTADELTATLLANGPFARDDAPFRLVELTGPDAGDFLQRLCTQDVLGLAEGRVAPAAFLNGKGKLLATCLVFRLGASFWLELQAAQEATLRELLERYHFTEKLSFAPGPARACHERVELGGQAEVAGTAACQADGLMLRYERRQVVFTRRYGGPAAGAAEPMADDLAECLRMCAGLVRVSVETEPNTLALEADLDDHCSTTKGCYTGQEIVARIHTYGHVNRRLCLLRLADGPAITAPVALHEREDDVPVGRVMHAVPAPGHGLRVGLGYLPKDFQAIGTRLALPDGGPVTVAGFQPLPA
jgi:folate-binding protein YgfZ